jgi:hypothetical protein
MKNLMMMTAAFLFLGGAVFGQVREVQLQAVSANTEIADFYQAALKALNQERSVMNSLQKKIRVATDDAEKRHYSWGNITLKRGYALAKEVKKTKGMISTAKYAEFQRKLGEVETDLDKLSGTSSAAGDPAPGTLGECWKSCNDAVGKGFGGGKGFDRFACKAGCIITNYP